MADSLRKDSKIVIVGAGVFGLSTTLHLLKRGYSNIHIFDRQPFDKKRPKAQTEKWNEQLAGSPKESLPECLSPDVPLWHNCGFLRLSSNGLEAKERETQENFPSEIKHTQCRVSDAARREDAANKDGIPFTKIDPFGRLERALPTDGILDTTAGYVLASRACAWALHLIMQSGLVTTRFGPDHALQSFMKTGNRASGIVTSGLENHDADLVLVACGGWTPSLMPEVDRLLETTSGSVLSVQLPRDRQDLWDKYSEENFPVWSWNMGSYVPRQEGNIGGLYGLPRTPEGIVKVAIRGAKWTSYTRRSSVGEQLSYPQTHAAKVPAEAMRVIRGFVEENLPDLLDLDLSNLRLCWYTDSVDNSFLIDYVPNVDGLVVASGGSGHGFKFLPVLGEHIVDVIEKKTTKYTRLFKWRNVPDGTRNGLEDGPAGWRTLEKQTMAGNKEWREGLGDVSSKL